MKIQEKKRILAGFIETLVFQGIDITFILGKPLSHWDYKQLKDKTAEYYKGLEDQTEF